MQRWPHYAFLFQSHTSDLQQFHLYKKYSLQYFPKLSHTCKIKQKFSKGSSESKLSHKSNAQLKYTHFFIHTLFCPLFCCPVLTATTEVCTPVLISLSAIFSNTASSYIMFSLKYQVLILIRISYFQLWWGICDIYSLFLFQIIWNWYSFKASFQDKSKEYPHFLIWLRNTQKDHELYSKKFALSTSVSIDSLSI